jgi:hypothetical protein
MTAVRPSNRVLFRVNFGVLAALFSTVAVAGVGAWTTSGPPQGGDVVVADQRNPGVLYASAFQNSFSNPAKPYRSIDNGATWSAVGDRNCQFQSLIPLATAPPSTVYFAGGYLIPPNGNYGVVVASTDGGASCSGPLFEPEIYVGYSLAVDALNRMKLFVSASGCCGRPFSVSRSLDAGATWTRVDSGLAFGTTTIGSLVADPKISGTLYLATEQSLFKSIDSGTAWVSLATVAGQIFAVAIDSTNSSVVYMGGTPSLSQGSSGSVVKSVDGGATFSGAGVGLPNSPVGALCVNPRNSMQVFAGTNQGVFVSLDGGASWQAMNSGLTDLSVISLAIDPVGEYIHAGTGSGVFDFQLASPTCATDSHTLCLNSGRFSVSASFSESPGVPPAPATAVSLTNDTGYFWFFDPANIEMVVKVLTGCSVNGQYWVFAGGLTNVGVEWRVTDTLTEVTKTYSNAAGTPFQPVQDSSAFPCP